MSFRVVLAVLPFLIAGSALATHPVDSLARHLLPNGEPVVGVYYYPWFGGEPYQRVGWHPEFQYDNQQRPDHIREVLRAIADHGINQASYSYWGDGSLPLYRTHMAEAERLLAEGWPLYLSPYMEPPTIQKNFASPEAQQYNIDRLTHFLSAVGRSPAFCSLGGDAFTNIYVAYDVPDETDEDFRAFLRARYGTIEKLTAAWSMLDAPEALRGTALSDELLPKRWEDVTLANAAVGTVAFADRQELRAQRLKAGWQTVIDGVKARTGLSTRYTGDNSNTILSPTRYMDALTGLGWYSFNYAMTNPTRRPKLISEVAKYTGTDFQYTIAPGYVDRQQRWPGARVEHDPFLYEYAWVKTLQSLPEGIMILTHSEWFEGSIIDVTKEYGRLPYETTELYASLYKTTYQDAFRHKREKKPVAVVFNEWATYGVNERGAGLSDVYGLIKALEGLSVDFDVIPESFLKAEELAGRRLLLVPSCGLSLHPDKELLLAEWVKSEATARIIADATPFWSSVKQDAGGKRVILAGERLGERLSKSFEAAWREGQAPSDDLQSFEKLLTAALKPAEIWAEGQRPSSSYEIARGPVLWAGNTAIVTVANTLPWAYITTRRLGNWSRDLGDSADEILPWRRESVTVTVKLPPGTGVAQILLLDSDDARLIDGPQVGGDKANAQYDPKTGLLTLRCRTKFHAVYAVVTGPVALAASGLTLHPGGQAQASIRLVNRDAQKAVEGTIELIGPPDLKARPVQVKLAAGKSANVRMALSAGPDCAVGDRTVVFKLTAAGKPAYYWYRLEVTDPALVGLKTGVVTAEPGKPRRVALTLTNVGRQEARDVQVELLGARGTVTSLPPGKDQPVALTIDVPAPAKPNTLPIELSWQAGNPPIENGITQVSGGDGVTRAREAEGLLGIEPDPATTGSQYIYFRVDKTKLPPGDYAAEAEVEYFDEEGSFLIEYDSAFGDTIEDRFRDSDRLGPSGERNWKKTVFELPRCHFAGRQNLQADLRISGHVLVRRLTLRPMTPRGRMRTEQVSLRWRCGTGEFSTMASLRLAEPASVAPPAGVPAGAEPLWVSNPYGEAVPEAPVEIPLSKLSRVPQGQALVALDHEGHSWPVLRDGERLRAVLPLDSRHPVYIAPAEDQSEDLTIRDRSTDLGFVAAQNRRFAALWDARRGGCLMSLVDMTSKHDYASPTAGACTVEYTLADRTHRISSEWGSTVKVTGQSPLYADLVATAEGPDLQVEDHWRMYSGARLLRLDRTVTFTRQLAAVDFCPLVLRLSPEYFTQVLPLGAGFQKEGGPKRGWIETWHSEGWYSIYGGEPRSPLDHLGVIVCRADSLRRVRYGFIPGEELPDTADPSSQRVSQDEMQIRLRAQADYTAGLPWLIEGFQVPADWNPPARRVYEPGDKIQVRVILAVARGCSWELARQLALLEHFGSVISTGLEPPAGGAQIGELLAPRYMYRVHTPYPSTALAVDRQPDVAPEVNRFGD